MNLGIASRSQTHAQFFKHAGIIDWLQQRGNNYSSFFSYLHARLKIA
jgi:hypothetical protein